MQKIILTFLFLFIGFAAFAQNLEFSASSDTQHEEKAEFMTSQIETLITDMSSDQKTVINVINVKYFYKETQLITRITTEAQADRDVQLNALHAELKQKYTNRMQKQLTAPQYTLFIQNLENFFSNITNEFGE